MIEPQKRLKDLQESGFFPQRTYIGLKSLVESHLQSLKKHQLPVEQALPVLHQIIDLVEDQVKNPYQFSPYHQRELSPINFYQFGLDFIRPLTNFAQSKVWGLEHLDKIEQELSEGRNVVFLGNHQSELDPQVLSLLLERTHPKIAREVIFVAGHRVVTDPVAVPFSRGRNLLCIHSKRRMDHPPEEKEEKLLHNKRTMQLMSRMLQEGGHCIYVAPSGGRDRPNSSGIVEVAPFDPSSVAMFVLMANQAAKKGKQTSFYPLALDTYQLLPPPDFLEVELGEVRRMGYAGLQLAFGKALSFEKALLEKIDKKEKRLVQAKLAEDEVCRLYEMIFRR